MPLKVFGGQWTKQKGYRINTRKDDMHKLELLRLYP